MGHFKKPKIRHLSRDSQHRQALLRNMIDKLFERETITTSWAKAKEAQKLAEKVITMGKKNTEESRREAQSYLYRPHLHLPKIFGEYAQRYADRAGGYTRVSRIESPKEDQADSAILELVDGPYDMKFHLVARTIAYRMRRQQALTELCKQNIKKVTQFRENGAAELKKLVARFEEMGPFEGGVPRKAKRYPNVMSPSPMERFTDRINKQAKDEPWW